MHWYLAFFRMTEVIKTRENLFINRDENFSRVKKGTKELLEKRKEPFRDSKHDL